MWAILLATENFILIQQLFIDDYTEIHSFGVHFIIPNYDRTQQRNEFLITQNKWLQQGI